MSVFIIDPVLTVGELPLARAFFSACREELEQHLSVTVIKTREVALSTRLADEDGVVVFNRADQEYPEAVLSVLEDAQKVRADIFPVAMEPATRPPAKVVQDRQSFDVTEQLRHRKLGQANIATVATAFARAVVCDLQPTLSKQRMRLFISHRRFDGEEIAAVFYEQLRIRAENGFRDLIDIRVGQNAQEVIESNLQQSDAVIFLDTPKAGESEWIARELQIALSMNLPIVWIKIGPDKDRAPLKVVPAKEPHFNLPGLLDGSEKMADTLIDDILQMAFRISRDSASKVFDQIRRIKSLIDDNEGEILEEDKKNFLFRVRIARKGFRYAQRPLTNLVQFYGRWPRSEDETLFESCATRCGYESDSRHGPVYDAALLLGPIPNQFPKEVADRPLYVDSSEEYVSALERYFLQSKTGPAKKGVIISGAFPDCEPEYQQHLTDAVYSFVRAILERPATIIFGGHPTFQPLVFEKSRHSRPLDFKKAVRLYVSTHFVKKKDLGELRKHAITTATKSVKGDREASLTIMREAMIADRHAIALVAMGGKTKVEREQPGVDQEIELARKAGLPVFLVGSAGGRATEIAAEHSARGWRDRLNALTPEQNEELMVSLDYGYLARMVLDHLKI